VGVVVVSVRGGCFSGSLMEGREGKGEEERGGRRGEKKWPNEGL